MKSKADKYGAPIGVLKPEDWFEDPELPFSIGSSGVTKSYPPHSHEFFEFFLMTGGKLYHSLDGDEQVIEKGDIVLLNPAREHSFRLASETPAITLQVIFLPSFLGIESRFHRQDKSLAELIFMLPFYEEGCAIFRLSGKARLKVQSLLEELLEEYQERDRGYVTAIRAKLTDLLITVARTYEKEAQKNPTSHKKLTGTADSILDSLAYIDEHFTEDLVLEDVAEQTTGVTKEHFSRIFHTITGTTFTKYIAGLRIAKAKRLLGETNIKVIDICHESGFNDLSHFNRTFRKHTGVTPSQFRKGGRRETRTDTDKHRQTRTNKK